MNADTLLVLLPLGAAVLHAVWNTILKTSGDRLVTITVINATGILLGLPLIVLTGWPEAAILPWMAGSLLIHTVYAGFLIWAYAHGDLSQVYPLARGIAPVLVAVFGWTVFDELLSTAQWTGIVIVSLGILTLATQRGKTASGQATLAALLTGLMIASYNLVDAQGVRAGSTPLQFITWWLIFGSFPLVVITIWRRRGRLAGILRRQWKTDLSAGVIANISYGGILWAFSLGVTAGVVALRETSVIIAAALGAWLLREGFGARRIGAACLVAAGVIILVVL